MNYIVKITLFTLLTPLFANSMQKSELMPRFKPSAEAQNLLDLTDTAPMINKTIKEKFKDKLDLYYTALAHRDYPTGMCREPNLVKQLLDNSDVLEAILVSAESARYTSRNDYINIFFTEAACNNHVNGLKFFIEHGIKINEVEEGEPLYYAIRNGCKEAEALLRQHGAIEKSVDPLARGLKAIDKALDQ